MTVLVAAGVIRRANDPAILLTRRPTGTHLEGLWEFPGGKVEEGEDPRDALVREVREECGVEIEVDEIVDVIFHAYPKKSVLLLFYEARLVSGDIQHLEVADHAWVPPEKLRDYPLPPADEPLLKKLIA